MAKNIHIFINTPLRAFKSEATIPIMATVLYFLLSPGKWFPNSSAAKPVAIPSGGSNQVRTFDHTIHLTKVILILSRFRYHFGNHSPKAQAPIKRNTTRPRNLPIAKAAMKNTTETMEPKTLVVFSGIVVTISVLSSVFFITADFVRSVPQDEQNLLSSLVLLPQFWQYIIFIDNQF